jgi:hypothetical protein
MIIPKIEKFAEIVLKETSDALIVSEKLFNTIIKDVIESTDDKDDFQVIVRLLARLQVMDTAIVMAMPLETPKKTSELITLIRQQVTLSQLALGILTREDVALFYPNIPLELIDKISPLHTAAADLKESLEKIEELKES